MHTEPSTTLFDEIAKDTLEPKVFSKFLETFSDYGHMDKQVNREEFKSGQVYERGVILARLFEMSLHWPKVSRLDYFRLGGVEYSRRRDNRDFTGSLIWMSVYLQHYQMFPKFQQLSPKGQSNIFYWRTGKYSLGLMIDLFSKLGIDPPTIIPTSLDSILEFKDKIDSECIGNPHVKDLTAPSDRFRNELLYAPQMTRGSRSSHASTHHSLSRIAQFSSNIGSFALILARAIYTEEVVLEIVDHFIDEKEILRPDTFHYIISNWQDLKLYPASWILATIPS